MSMKLTGYMEVQLIVCELILISSRRPYVCFADWVVQLWMRPTVVIESAAHPSLVG
jgi:hypothetical protein